MTAAQLLEKREETLTARRRKEQVLTAAAECFRRSGFHRTSMADIAAASGMRSGHIYHYFGSKEGIVEAIVARENSELGLLVDEVKTATRSTDAATAIVDHMPQAAARYMDRGRASLMMDILAEATRNPEIAGLVQRADDEVRQAFYGLLGDASPETQSRCEIIAALLDGLAARALRNPALADTLDQKMLQRVVRNLLAA